MFTEEILNGKLHFLSSASAYFLIFREENFSLLIPTPSKSTFITCKRYQHHILQSFHMFLLALDVETRLLAVKTDHLVQRAL